MKKQRLKNHLERKEIKNKLKSGENPVYKKKCESIIKLCLNQFNNFIVLAVKKMETLIEKYEELKKQNKLQKHIEKREKKLKRKRELVN